MNALVMDCSTEYMILGLLKENKLVSREFESGLQHATIILEEIDGLLKTNGMGISDLDFIGVGLGPGSFTGLRIALSTARGLALGADLPLYGTSTIEAIHHSAEYESYLLVSIFGKRGRFFTSLYHQNQLVWGPFDIDSPTINGKLPTKGKIQFIGPGTEKLLGELDLSIEPWQTEKSKTLWSKGLMKEIMNKHEKKDVLPENASPLYLRLSEAEEKLKNL